MLEYFIICLIPALIVTGIMAKIYAGKEGHYGSSVGSITAKEFAFSIGANFCIALVSLLFFHGYFYSAASDRQVYNGVVSSKQQTRVSCEHSYSCNCRTTCSGSGKTRSCSTRCDTCYDHTNDWDWDVKTTIGNITIARVDRRGSNTPPRWDAVRIGEPASMSFHYENYLLVDKDNLFLTDKKTTKQYALPNYPEVVDYYRINRVFNMAGTQNIDWLNNYFNEWLIPHGWSKQVNIVAVFTKEDRGFFDALMAHWNGGKKNDVILVYGMDGNKVKWFEANTYAKGMRNRHVISELRDVALEQPFSKELVDKQLLVIKQKFERISAEEFEDKKYDVELPFWFIFFVVSLNGAASFGVSRLMLSK